MKILHIVTNDSCGGAAKAAYRISCAINSNNVESKMLVLNKLTDNSNIETGTKTKIQKLYNMILPHLDCLPLKCYKNRQNTIFSPGSIGINISNYTQIKESDIIHLHWINAGFLSIKNISQVLSLGKPVVWTLHDMWPFTGGCHYSNTCTNYKNHCGKCPILMSKSDKDLSYRILKKKLELFGKPNMHIVTCSKWLGTCASESTLFKKFIVNVIPNCLDVQIFKPMNKSLAKDVLNIPKYKKVILFGAVNSTSDKRKGFDYLVKSLSFIFENFPNIKDDYELLVFGASYSDDISKLSFNIKFLGKLADEYSLSLCYNAADVFVAPSNQENLANTVIESLSCGTPVVAFNIGGMPDMIKHKYNGYLAKDFDIEDLANGIMWCTSKDNAEILSTNSREYVLSNYTHNIISKKYIELYNNIIQHN